VVSCSDAALGTLTVPVPLNVSPPPNLPVAVRVTPVPNVPVLPRPETSKAVVPAGSLNPYAATKPFGGGDPDMVTVTVAGAEVLPAASRAITVIVFEPPTSGTLAVQLVVPVAVPD